MILLLFSFQEVTVKESELVNLRKLIEREFQDKIKIEDLIMSQMQEQLTAEKASQYTKKMTNRIRRKSTQLVGKRHYLWWLGCNQ